MQCISLIVKYKIYVLFISSSDIDQIRFICARQRQWMGMKNLKRKMMQRYLGKVTNLKYARLTPRKISDKIFLMQTQ